MPAQAQQLPPLPPSVWWFHLGHEPLLSIAELFAVLSPTNYSYHQPFFRCASALLPEVLIKKLGGTIKIGLELATSLSEEQLLECPGAELQTIDGKIEFGISSFTETAEIVGAWGKEIKNQLKTAGRSVRFVFNNEATLSSASVTKNRLADRGREFIVARQPLNQAAEARFDVAVTRAVQPFEEFSERDYGRPGRDDVSGMLPPKLALMMLNLSGAGLDETVLDPFCGSGTILTEALLQGYLHLVGSDFAAKAIEDTKKNIEWFKNKPQQRYSAAVDLHTVPVKNLATILPTKSVAAIATEPYMGPPIRGKEKPEQLRKTCAELGDLYILAFTQFAQVLKPDGVVIFIIPRFTVSEARYTISDRIIPELKALGFSKERLLPDELTPTSYLLYQRPRQYVGREIWKFRLKK